MITVIPFLISVQEWCDFSTPVLETFGQIPQLEGDDWQSWARAVVQIPGIALKNPPNPDQFTDWVVWADRFNQAIEA